MASRVAALFRARNADRLGIQAQADPELDSYGESLGIAPRPRTRPQQQQQQGGMPQAPGGMPQAPGGMAGAPGMAPAPPPAQGTGLAARGGSMPATNPPAPPQPQRGVPALDAMRQQPQQPTRGYAHDRRLGRVAQFPTGAR